MRFSLEIFFLIWPCFRYLIPNLVLLFFNLNLSSLSGGRILYVRIAIHDLLFLFSDKCSIGVCEARMMRVRFWRFVRRCLKRFKLMVICAWVELGWSRSGEVGMTLIYYFLFGKNFNAIEFFFVGRCSIRADETGMGRVRFWKLVMFKFLSISAPWVFIMHSHY